MCERLQALCYYAAAIRPAAPSCVRLAAKSSIALESIHALELSAAVQGVLRKAGALPQAGVDMQSHTGG